MDHGSKYASARADEAADATKSTYNKIKDSLGGFFGNAKESADQCAPHAQAIASCVACSADSACAGTGAAWIFWAVQWLATVLAVPAESCQSARRQRRLLTCPANLCRTASAASDKTHDVAHKAAATVNKGVDKAHEGQRSVYESTPSQGEVHAHGKEAYESAKDTAVHTKCAGPSGMLVCSPSLYVKWCNRTQMCVCRSAAALYGAQPSAWPGAVHELRAFPTSQPTV